MRFGSVREGNCSRKSVKMFVKLVELLLLLLAVSSSILGDDGEYILFCSFYSSW